MNVSKDSLFCYERKYDKKGTSYINTLLIGEQDQLFAGQFIHNLV